MKQLFNLNRFLKRVLLLSILLANVYLLLAEGSKGFRDYPDYRLFYNAEQRQPLKVYATEGAHINLSASHMAIGGGISGNNSNGIPRATIECYTFQHQFRNNRLLDYWAFAKEEIVASGEFAINIETDCSRPILDFDKDLIPDFIDLDDDNDGIADFSEYCNPEGDWVCLPGGLDPSADNDNDNIPNYLDSSDPLIDNACQDFNEDGICDQVPSIYDTDGDGVPDHLDLDSDNDGITDLVEAGHLQPDIDGNGIIDGDASFFGRNGLFNAIASDPDDLAAFELYTRWDGDRDAIPDHDDLDSDNDGIYDVTEANFGFADTNNDGRIDNGLADVPLVGDNGLVSLIDPIQTNRPIPMPPDTDFDGVADWHDLDTDNDGINDVGEAVATDPDNDGIIGMGVPLVDLNGIALEDELGNRLFVTARVPNTDKDELPDYKDLDADNDGINDVNEADLIDPDGDGRLGEAISLVNEQGQIFQNANEELITTISNPKDTDGDTRRDFQDIDRDNDGIFDIYECPTGWPCINTDEDLLPDIDDLDSDNDQLLDSEECPGGFPCPDRDLNSLANYLQFDCNARNTPSPSSVEGSGQFCEGAPVILRVSGDTAFKEEVDLIWTGPNDFQLRQRALASDKFILELPNTQAQASGTYQLVMETAAGCTSEPLQMIVDLKENPLAPQLTIPKNELCVGEVLQLTVNNFSGQEVFYTWYKQTQDEFTAIATTDVATLILEEAQVENAGLYTATVNVDGCPSSFSNADFVRIRAVESPLAVSSSTILNPACEGEQIELSVPFQEGAIYEWIGPGDFSANVHNPIFNNASPLNNGNYRALVTLDGCTVQSNVVTVMVSPRPTQPSLSLDGPILCEEATATLSIKEPISYPAHESLQFNWYKIGQNTPINTSLTPNLELLDLNESDNGDYYVEVSLLGCESIASNIQEIQIQPKVNLTATTSATPQNPACEGDLVTLVGSLFEGATYQWVGPDFISDQPSASFRNATTDISGDYFFMATINGCLSISDPISVLVNPQPITPVLALDNPSPCTGEEASLKIKNIAILEENSIIRVDWFDNNTQELLNTTNVLEWRLDDLTDFGEGGIYSILTVDGCSSNTSNVQTIDAKPGLIDIQIQSNALADVSPICEGDEAILTVPLEDGVTYQWFNAEDDLIGTDNSLIIPNATSSTSGTYYVIREKDACTRRSEAVTIAVNPIPNTPELTIVEEVQCLDGAITFMINNPQEILGSSEVLYSWYHVQTNQLLGTSTHPIYTLTNLTAENNGTYYVVLSIDGCSSQPSNTSRVIVREPAVSLIATASEGIDSPICEGTTLSLNAPFLVGANYEWIGPNGFTSNLPNPTIPELSLADTGIYYAVITSNVCPFITNELEISVKPKPVQPVLATDEEAYCEGDSANYTILNALEYTTTEGASFHWHDAHTDMLLATTTEPFFSQAELKGGMEQSIYVQAIQNECTSQSSNEITLSVTTIPTEQAFIMDMPVNICNETAVDVQAMPPLIGMGAWSSTSDLTFISAENPNTMLVDLVAGKHTIYWSLSYGGCENYSVDSITISQSSGDLEARDDEFTMEFNGFLANSNITQNDLISEENTFEVKLVSQPIYGVLDFDNGSISYQPDQNFFGLDQFEYEICHVACKDVCDNAIVRLKVVDTAQDGPCFAPNVITPNGDGMNDMFKIPCVANQTNSNLQIFNRWGDLVYETNNYENNWEGTHNGNPLPNGTYFYILNPSSREASSMKGYFTLVR